MATALTEKKLGVPPSRRTQEGALKCILGRELRFLHADALPRAHQCLFAANAPASGGWCFQAPNKSAALNVPTQFAIAERLHRRMLFIDRARVGKPNRF